MTFSNKENQKGPMVFCLFLRKIFFLASLGNLKRLITLIQTYSFMTEAQINYESKTNRSKVIQLQNSRDQGRTCCLQIAAAVNTSLGRAVLLVEFPKKETQEAKAQQ